MTMRGIHETFGIVHDTRCFVMLAKGSTYQKIGKENVRKHFVLLNTPWLPLGPFCFFFHICFLNHNEYTPDLT